MYHGPNANKYFATNKMGFSEVQSLSEFLRIRLDGEYRRSSTLTRLFFEQGTLSEDDRTATKTNGDRCDKTTESSASRKKTAKVDRLANGANMIFEGFAYVFVLRFIHKYVT